MTAFGSRAWYNSLTLVNKNKIRKTQRMRGTKRQDIRIQTKTEKANCVINDPAQQVKAQYSSPLATDPDYQAQKLHLPQLH
uniref:Uncharacterized protein n=1 Tax=Anguilla anguilla TaxID=7936 RepID=A0A0E9XS21_ANGAN